MLKSESYKKGLIYSTGFNILAKGIAFLNSLILAYFFGTNISTDIYFYVLSVALLITNTINAIDYLVLIPEAIRLREKQGEKSSQDFLNFFTWVYAAIGLVISFLILLSPTLFFNLFSKFNTSDLNNHRVILSMGCILIVFQLLNNFLNAILVSYKYFTMPIFTGLINSIFTITLTVVFYKQLGIAGTMIGVICGYILNFILLLIVLKKFQAWNFFSIQFVKNKTVWKNIALIELNILPVWFRNYIAIYLISGLGSGVITALNLGQLLASLPEVLILTQIASIIGIKFSELSANRDFAQTEKLLVDILNSLFVILMPLAVILAISNKEIIQLVFQRGDFNLSSTIITAYCFFYFSLMLPSKVYDLIFTRLFTSFQVYGLSTIIAVTGHVIITILTYFAIVNFKLQGYFISQLIGYYFIMPVLFYIILKLRFKKIKIKKILLNYFLIIITLPVVFLICYVAYINLHFNFPVNFAIIAIIAYFITIILSRYTMDLQYLEVNIMHATKKLKQIFYKSN